MTDVKALRDWAVLLEQDGRPDKAKLIRDAADELENLRARLVGEQSGMCIGVISPSTDDRPNGKASPEYQQLLFHEFL